MSENLRFILIATAILIFFLTQKGVSMRILIFFVIIFLGFGIYSEVIPEEQKTTFLFVMGMSVFAFWLYGRLGGMFGSKMGILKNGIHIPQHIREEASNMADGTVSYFETPNGELVYGQVLDGEFIPSEIEFIEEEDSKTREIDSSLAANMDEAIEESIKEPEAESVDNPELEAVIEIEDIEVEEETPALTAERKKRSWQVEEKKKTKAKSKPKKKKKAPAKKKTTTKKKTTAKKKGDE